MVNSLETPRITGYLRTTGLGKGFDPQGEYIKRKPLLTRKVAKKPVETADIKSTQTLSLKYFGDDATDATGAGKEKRTTYNQFLSTLVKVIGEESTTDEVHSAAFQVFYTCTTPGKSDLGKKESLAAVFGPIPPNEFATLNKLSLKLAEWHSPHEEGSVPSESSSASSSSSSASSSSASSSSSSSASSPSFASAPIATTAVEWGSGLHLAFDVDELGMTSVLLPANNKTPSTKSAPTPIHIEEEDFEDYYVPDSNGSVVGQFVEAVKSETQVDENWLLRQCDAMINLTGSAFSASELSSNILSLLKSNKTDLVLSNDLLEMLGFESFDFVELLMKNRVKILAAQTGQPRSKSNPTYGTQVTIQTEDDRFVEKLRRKEKKKKSGKQGDQEKSEALDPALLRRQREEALAQGPARTLLPDQGPRSHGALFGSSMLPEGTTRKSYTKFEEVLVPAVIPPPLVPSDLVPITAFDDFAQLAFKGYKNLNRIQSKLFPAAYHSNENLLICAPTGAGKTNVAMMCILREIGQNFTGGYLHKDQFKIVYVAPMKALAAEMTASFASRLAPLGIIVKELTGDMQLTKKQLTETQIIVTTPEKWDVITRKSSDVALTALVRLLIIDEVHLLHEDRGPVIETLIARTLRQVETSQSMIRIVGLSATLPNYMDVASFLRVNSSGLFYFDSSYRPVPLTQHYIGVKESNPMQAKNTMNDICYQKVKDSVRAGNQVMVFVHSRKDTFKTAEKLFELAQSENQMDLFAADKDPKFKFAMDAVSKSRNRELNQLFPHGFSMHHAGMLRSDRNIVEKWFAEGLIKVLVCTATLAWGVNLPAHTVVIKGTQIYDAKKGSFVELGMLDVMQIFGRAGRPQFDTSGEGIIITTHDKLNHYLTLMTHQLPIESQFISHLPDHLNAEIVLGTVSNIKEAISWLSYTYLYVRMMKNPMVYGISYDEKGMDPTLDKKRRDLILEAAKKLDMCQMIRFAENSETLSMTDLGRIASHYYIEHESIMMFNDMLKSNLSEADILNVVAHSHEFEHVMLREEEMGELDDLLDKCPIPVKGGAENKEGKVNILLQSYLSNSFIDGFALVSDSNYVAQNSARILRALFEYALKKGWTVMVQRILTLCKMVDRRVWGFQHPLRQFATFPVDVLSKLEAKNVSIDRLQYMTAAEVGAMINHPKMGAMVLKTASYFPRLELDVTIQPITRTVLRVQLNIDPQFEWSDRIHGSVEPWWIFVEDTESERIYHHEYFLLHKAQHQSKDEQPIQLVFTVPISEPLPPQYYVHAISDRWLGVDTVIPMSFKHLILPHQHPPHTELLDLTPLPTATLQNKDFAALYPFEHFNPIQTQVFHTMYYTDHNVLLGSPTGSGKTICAEFAMLKVFRDLPSSKVVYIGPLKALVRERMNDWLVKFGQKLGKKVIELTGDYTPNIRDLQASDIVLTTPEKWDGISRSWKSRTYVKDVALLILDEIHLLGEDRGPILEVIVSRMRYISSQTESPVRVIGLSTALANARDLADWMGIEGVGLYNFRPSVRPVPLEVHIQGYPGKHYCPRMATMNKPTYAAITTHSPEKPVLVFVSSRRQTRLTALDLITFCVADENPRQWLHMDESELDAILDTIRDASLKHTLSFGIGLHHAGLSDGDRQVVENLFGSNKIQLLVSTSTLAWGVNLPAHLVIIKGTEFFDAKTKRYIDFPITDVLQMMGRAGRPQFDNQGKAVIMVEESKKNFYKKFLYEPFPVESSLGNVFHDHFNAEIVAGTITSKQDAVEYLTWTYFFRRLLMNPTYYNLEDTSTEAINKFLSEKVDSTLSDLETAHCITIDETEEVTPQTLGRIASFYYLHYTTMKLFHDTINADNDLNSLLQILCDAGEYDELPVRHNEDKLNEELAQHVPWAVDARRFDDPHIKTHLLLQAHFSELALPISDYITDTKSVLDQAVRILQAMVDVSADSGWLYTTLKIMNLLQMVVQGRWLSSSSLLTLPFFTPEIADAMYEKFGIDSLPELLSLDQEQVAAVVRKYMKPDELKDLQYVTARLPVMNVKLTAPKTVTIGGEAAIKVEISRPNKGFPKGASHAPKFPKQKDEGWWLVLGDTSDGQLLALRRMAYMGKSTSTSLTFDAPMEEGPKTLQLYLLSDSYLGLDQQYSVNFDVV
eukprot:Phypoly_transcript_00144.p1 GENE.Phypoly_transcript_00144~~Phypoly_transcript_00144.p1  ORF type:complete len:2136 (-),score=361.95 Phypoly_transcript_00144:17-6424(-)